MLGLAVRPFGAVLVRSACLAGQRHARATRWFLRGAASHEGDVSQRNGGIMKRLDAAAHDEAVILDQVGLVLQAGGVVIFPTETFYGLAVDPRNPVALTRIFEIKGRDASKALPLIASDVAQAWRAARHIGRDARVLAERFWPGPLTLVVPACDDLVDLARATHGTVAVRVSSHPLALAVARAAGGLVTATSANRSGDAPFVDAMDAAAALPGCDLLVDGGRCRGGQPSTVVDVTIEPPRLVRAGVIAWERVLESLR